MCIDNVIDRATRPMTKSQRAAARQKRGSGAPLITPGEDESIAPMVDAIVAGRHKSTPTTDMPMSEVIADLPTFTGAHRHTGLVSGLIDPIMNNGGFGDR